MKRISLVASCVLLAACASAGVRQDAVVSGQGGLEEVFNRVQSSVVTIYTVGRTGVVSKSGKASTEAGVGSGVLISKEGKILTAAHVVQTADAVVVEFVDGTTIPARVVGSNLMADLALIKLEEAPPSSAAIAPLGDSDAVRVASRAFVVGAPLGISHSLTVGYVSARREASGVDSVEVIQTDAAINKGNSGGPLFNMQGEVIGIVSYIVSQSGGSEGLGFAISSNTARELLLDRNPIWTGIEFATLAGPFAEAFNVPADRIGLLIQRVAKGSPSELLGLRGGSIPAVIDERPILIGGDIILGAFGVELEDAASIEKVLMRIGEIQASDTIEILILRAGEKLELKRSAGELMPWLLEGGSG